MNAANKSMDPKMILTPIFRPVKQIRYNENMVSILKRTRGTLNFHLLPLALLSFMVGTLFIILTPPWWHHDEPGHFQVAWFAANHNRFPAVEEYDPAMRVDLARSLEKYRFYEFRNYRLDDNDPSPWVMSPQSSDPKLAYAIYSIPLRFTLGWDLAAQLILLRFMSLIYFVTLTLLIYRFTRELFPAKPVTATLAALFFTLLPGAVNQMTAVSNEPLGSLLFTAFLFFTHRALVKSDPNRSLIQQGIFAALAMFTITTVWIIIPILLMTTYYYVLLPKIWRKPIAIVLTFLALTFVLLSFKFDEARYWYQEIIAEQPARTSLVSVPDGELALQIPNGASIKQRVPQDVGKQLTNKTATIGFYVWSSVERSVELTDLVSIKYGALPSARLTLTTQPVWRAYPVTMEDEIGVIKIRFSAPASEKSSADAVVFISTPTFVPGEHSSVPPTFDDASLQSGVWDGARFANLLRNPNLRSVWPRFTLFFWKNISDVVPGGVNPSLLATIFDPPSSGWYFSRTIESITKTYWGKLGASNFELIGGVWIYPLFSCLFVITAIFGFIETIRGALKIPRRAIFVFAITLGWIWLQTILRGLGSLETDRIVIPWARYGSTTFPLIAILIAGSAAAVIQRYARQPIPRSIAAAFVLALPGALLVFALIDLYAIFEVPLLTQTVLNGLQIVWLVVSIAFLSIPAVNRRLRAEF